MYAQVCFPFFINKTFTYSVPNTLQQNIKSGTFVEVKFKNKLCKGFVVSISDTIKFKGSIKPILSIDTSNTMPTDLWKTLIWMANYYVTPIGKITQTTLSWAFNSKTVKNTSPNIDTFDSNQIDSLRLSSKQNKIYKKINTTFINNKKPHFLYGIPGSGKTEIYLKLTHKFISKGLSCLILIPEIALSSQIFSRFQHYFGNLVLLWHSQTSTSYKTDVLTQLREDNPHIIIGARSALFAPLDKLGLIIVDEEHDASYKESDRQPCYHARDLSIIRAKYSKSLIVLGSATPSLETYYNSAILNKYHLHELNERYGGSKIPQVKLININKENQTEGQIILSHYLIQAIKKRINNNEQVLILHNRRGFSSIKVCQEHDKILKCENCDIILTFHAQLNKLICHNCHYNYSFSKHQNTDIRFLGYGTEQLEVHLNELFPKNKILRMDFDSARSMKKQSNILNKFKNEKYNILLGTQMIAKGLDFSNITLVAVVNADLGMSIPDFRAHERMFQLISQVIGRSGRSHKKGEAIIQTYQPDHSIIQMATKYQFKKFYNLNLESRKSLKYPPFIRLVRFLFKSKNINHCINSANKIYQLLKIDFENFLIGPLPCPIEKLSNQLRYHILIKIPKSNFISSLKKIKDIQDKKEHLIHKNVKLLIDVDSISVL